ncbi:hypothetical protein F5Y06DRAFT_269999 [Hypoxylon sp. FL0890]|nr:hypothetical protein F5Y06DRAFT_269999 [Hypoxylon sp. FL0890]
MRSVDLMAQARWTGTDSRLSPPHRRLLERSEAQRRTAGTQGAVYDTSQQFPPRQAAGLQMMPADSTAPYFPNEPTNAAAAAGLQPQTGSSSMSAVYQQGPAGRRAMLQSYCSSMAPTSALEQVVEEPDYTASAKTGEAYE